MLKIIVIFLALKNGAGSNYDPDLTTVDVANSIARTLYTTCTVLIQSDNASWIEQRRTFRVAKMLTTKFQHSRTTVVKTFKEYIDHVSYRYNSNRCSKMLNIVYGYDDDVKKELENLSEKFSLGGPIWIIFLSSTTRPEEFLRFINVPFDSYFLTAKIDEGDYHVELEESYRVTMNHPIRTSHFGYWSPKNGLVTQYNKSLYLRRNDLEGLAFKVGSLENPPITSFVKDSKNQTTLDGYFGRVWTDLQETLNFTSVYTKPKDFATGAWNGTHWTGLIGMMTRKEIDLAVSEVTMVPERINVVDFLTPLFITRYQLFFKQPGFLIQWDVILRPFKTEVWLTIIVWLLVSAVVFRLTHHVGLKLGLEDYKLKNEFTNYRSFFVILSAFAQQGNPFIPKSAPCRIIVFMSYIFSVFILITYSGTLTSFIAVQKPWRPFNSLESFLKDGTYTLEQMAGTSGYTYFSNSSDALLQKIYQNLFAKKPDEELPQSHKEALERICNNHKVAHFGEYDISNIGANELMQEKGCRLLVFEQPLGMLFLTIIITKDSPYRKIFDFYLNRMSYQGTLKRYRKSAIPLYSGMNTETSAQFKPVYGEQVIQIHFVLLLGFGLSIGIILIEIMLRRKTNRRYGTWFNGIMQLQ